MKTKYPLLFKPITIRGVTFKNRILSAPLGVWALIPEDGLQESTLRYLSERAAGGAATVGMGDTQVNCGDPDCEAVGKVLPLRGPNVADAYLAEFADTIHQHGSLATIELAHVGAGGLSVDGNGTYGPMAKKGFMGWGHAMDEEKILHTLDCYAECAATMKRAGFKMLTVHGAHGKLIDQFFQPTNTRDDKWGGSLENRMRFPIAVIDRIRQAVGENFVIEMRISGVDPSEDPEGFAELVELVKALDGKVDIFNVSHEPGNSPAARKAAAEGAPAGPFGKFDGTTAMPGYLQKPMPNVPYALYLRKAVPSKNIYFGGVGAIITPELAEQALEDGCDFVIMGRTLLADPEFPKKARRNAPEEIRPCIGCLKCLGGMHETHIQRCAVNARTSKEYYTRPGEKAPVSRTVAVVGGGVAGMQAAITAAERGHTVTLYEQSDRLGGILASFRNEAEKYRLNMYRDYLVHQVENDPAICVKLNTRADLAMLQEANPDAVILASGSVPTSPKIPVSADARVLDILEASLRVNELSGRVVIVGGATSGMEFGIAAVNHGCQVTIVQAHPVMNPQYDFYLEKAEILRDARALAIDGETVSVRVAGQERKLPYDTVVYAGGLTPVNDLEESLREEFCAFWSVGDCQSVASVYEAVHSAYYAALDI